MGTIHCAPRRLRMCVAMSARVCKAYAWTHLDTHTHADANQLCMIPLTHSSDTPRLGDTGHYGNTTRAGSQVSLFPWGAVEEQDYMSPRDPSRKRYLLKKNQTRWDQTAQDAHTQASKVLRHLLDGTLSSLKMHKLRETQKLTLVTAINLCCHRNTSRSKS